MDDRMNDQKLSKMALSSFILSFLVLLPGLGFLFLPIVAILIIVSMILLKNNPALTGSKFLFASAFLCILGIFVNFYVISHPATLYRLFVRSSQDIIALSPESKDTLVEQARKMDGGEELIKQSTLSDGAIDTKKLFNLITSAQINEFDKITDEGQKMRQKRKEQERLSTLAYKYENEKKYDLSLDMLTKEIALYPEESSTYSTRARIYEKLNNYEMALQDLSQALDLLQKEEDDRVKKGQSEVDLNYIKASRASWLQNRGEIHMKMGAFESAVRDYSDAISNSISGNTSWLHFARGLAYRKLGDLEKTKLDWQTALSMGLKRNSFNEHESNADGEWNGKAVWYHLNGNVKTEGNYKNGKEDGTFKFYDENGNPRGERAYKEGIELK